MKDRHADRSLMQCMSQKRNVLQPGERGAAEEWALETKRKGRKESPCLGSSQVPRGNRHSRVFAVLSAVSWQAWHPSASLLGRVVELKWPDAGLSTTFCGSSEEWIFHALHGAEEWPAPGVPQGSQSDREGVPRGPVKLSWRAPLSSPVPTSSRRLALYMSYLLTFPRLRVHENWMCSLGPLSDCRPVMKSEAYLLPFNLVLKYLPVEGIFIPRHRAIYCWWRRHY